MKNQSERRAPINLIHKAAYHGPFLTRCRVGGHARLKGPGDRKGSWLGRDCEWCTALTSKRPGFPFLVQKQMCPGQGLCSPAPNYGAPAWPWKGVRDTIR